MRGEKSVTLNTEVVPDDVGTEDGREEILFYAVVPTWVVLA